EEGPLDKLQTREFRKIIAELAAFDPKLADPFYPYLLYSNFIHLQEALSVVSEIPTEVNSVLDVGSGLGAFALGAMMKGAKQATLLDSNPRLLDYGAELIGKMGYPVKTLKWICPAPLPKEKYDLILFGHSLFHLTDNPFEWIEKGLKQLNPNGYLIIVDSSQENINRKVLRLRDEIVKAGHPIQAPCVYRGPCVALEAKVPCYAQRELYKPHMIAEIQRAAKINQNSLKMSYLIVNNTSWPTVESDPFYRVISPPIDGYQGKLYYLCGKGGKKTLSSRLDSHPKESRAFEYLKRGELIEVENCLESKNHFTISSEAKVIVKAAVGKPVDKTS
ncbi:MAG: small ribosomal subunit Rsm22 family protein, partial [Parachlamydiaceae bacterium]